MKLIVGLFFASLLGAQTTHTAMLTWVDALNPVGATYSVYRAPGLCSGSPVFAKLATAVAALTYTDTSVAPGNYCFQISATAGGVESAPSNQAAAAVPSFAPTALQVTVK